MSKVIVNGSSYSKESESSELERLLTQHLGIDRINPEKIVLTDREFLMVKAWLIEQTEREMMPGSFSSIAHGIPGIDGGPMEVVFARGKTSSGEVILWHEPLPWPEDWGKEKVSLRAPSMLELVLVEGLLAIRYSGVIGVLTEAEAHKFVNYLKTMRQTEYDNPHVVLFENGQLLMRIFESHVNFEFEMISPRRESLSSSLDKNSLSNALPELERAIMAFYSSSSSDQS
jgi:hypothetical protein